MLEQLNDISRFEDDLHEKKIEYVCHTCRNLKELGSKFIKYEQENNDISVLNMNRHTIHKVGLVFTQNSMLYYAHTNGYYTKKRNGVIIREVAHDWGVYEGNRCKV